MSGMIMPNGQQIFAGGGPAPQTPVRPGPLNATASPSMSTRNTTQPDPMVQSWMRRLEGEVSRQQAGMNAPLTADTNRMLDRSATNIADQGAAASNTMDENLARRGIGGSGLEAQMRRDLAASTQRAQASAGADIQMKQQERQDDVNLRRQGLVNQLLGAGVGAANMPAQLALQQQGLGLQQMSLEQQMLAERERLRQMDLERQARESQMLYQNQMQSGIPAYGGTSYGSTTSNKSVLGSTGLGGTPNHLGSTGLGSY